MAYTQSEAGYRNEATEEYKGHRLRVVSAYDGRSDAWWVHVYLAKPGLEEMKVHSLDGTQCGSAEEGLRHGFAEGKALIDQSV